nr:PREDICTED: uncharacterized protein LOC108226157 [Daucus carota subsp. sativus]XP_017256591.1 PREDICTED: uncharacterized protein LOC108226159 [Daucus carota subsp. sativus]
MANTVPIVDPSSVFYIHPSEATTNQLVSVKFNGSGFANWKRSMLLSLSTRNKLGFVNGTILKPDVNDPDYVLWERCNSLVTTWILFNLDETIASSVLYFKTAKDIWKDLEARFGLVSITQVYSLQQQLADISQGKQTVSEFYTAIKAIWDRLDDVDPIPQNTA